MNKCDICSIVDRQEHRPSEFSDHHYTDATIIIKQLFGYGYVKFRTPLKISVSIDEEDRVAHYTYDFGMDDEVSVNPKSNFYASSAVTDPVEIVLNTIKYDIEHALFHTDIDPNFSHTHWALRAILEDRIEEAMNWYDADEASVEQQMEFDFS
jgi:hypothetical protein